MRNFFGKILTTAGCLSVLLLAPVNADAGYYNNDCCDPCEQSCCDCGGFGVGVDFLYWKPYVNNLDFAATLKTTAYSGTYTGNDYDYHFKRICHCWEPGVRVYAYKEDVLCHWTLGASWTYVGVCDTASCKGSSEHSCISTLLPAWIQAQNGTYDEIKGKHELCYHNWDITMAYPCDFCQCNVWTPYFGIDGLYVDHKLKANYYSDSETGWEGYSNWSSCFHAVGFKVGQHFDFNLNDCLTLFTDASGTISYSNPDIHQKHEIYDDSNKYSSSHKENLECHVIPGFHLQIGLAYQTCWCDKEFSVRFGWDFLRWFNLPTARRFAAASAQNGGALSSHEKSELGFQGLLLGVDLSF